MTPQVLEKLKSVAARYEELTRLVSDPVIQADQSTYRTHSKALAELQETVDRFREFEEVERELTGRRKVRMAVRRSVAVDHAESAAVAA